MFCHLVVLILLCGGKRPKVHAKQKGFKNLFTRFVIKTKIEKLAGAMLKKLSIFEFQQILRWPQPSFRILVYWKTSLFLIIRQIRKNAVKIGSKMMGHSVFSMRNLVFVVHVIFFSITDRYLFYSKIVQKICFLLRKMPRIMKRKEAMLSQKPQRRNQMLLSFLLLQRFLFLRMEVMVG